MSIEASSTSLWSAIPNVLRFRRDPIAFLEELKRRSDGRFRFRLGPMTVNVFTRPEDIERVYASTKTLERSSLMKVVRPLTGDSILISSGEAWRKKRLIAQPVFQPARIAGLQAMMHAIVEKHLAVWAVRGPQGIDMRQSAIDLTLEIATEALFGRGLSDMPPSFYGDIDRIFEILRRKVDNPFSPPQWAPTLGNLQLKRAIRNVDRFVYGLIDERIRAGGEGNDLLSILLRSSRKENGQLDRTSTRNEVITYFFAGFETTASTLTWTVYELARHPQYIERVRDEAQAANVDGLTKLQWPQRVIKESLRLHPPAWFADFGAVAPTPIHDVIVGPGEHVWLSQYLTHRDPSLWTDADRFYPERFNPEVEQGRHKYAFFPFGAANRHCIGQGFAMLELQLVVSLLCQRLQWTLEEEREVPAMVGFVLRPGAAVRCRMVARN